MATPAIIFAYGTQNTTSSEVTLFELIADRYARAYLNLKNMQSGDTYRFRIYVWDEQLGEYMKIESDATHTYSNVQDPAGKRLPFEAATRYKVTVQRTAGVDRAVTWLRASV